jgi:hypothetical protein
MRSKTGRAFALSTLVVGLIAWPIFAAPPRGLGGQAGKGNSGGGSGRVVRGATGQTTGNNAGTNSNNNGNVGGSNVRNVNGSNANNNKEKSALSLLHDARHELSGSHFAYDGHRTLAMKEIQRAIKDLTPPNPNAGQQVTQKRAASSAPKGNARPQGTQAQTQKTAPKEKPPQTQAASDAKLRAALKYLNRAHAKVQAMNSDAAENVEAAISELNLALGVQ